MTALTEYERLEATGLWRPNHYDQRRDVLVSLGNATLGIMDMRERPLAHWSLPAIERRNPGKMPAIFTPGPDAREELEIADSDMVDAIERVRRAVQRHRPRAAGRLRRGISLTALIAIVGAAVFWLPGALSDHAAAVTPPIIRADTASRLLQLMQEDGASPCDDRGATALLPTLSDRLLGPSGGQIVVMSGGVSGVELLPGRIMLVNRSLVETHDSPNVMAGHILAELARAEDDPPMNRILREAGLRPALHFLMRGELSDAALRRYRRSMADAATKAPPPYLLLDRFADAGIPPEAYAEEQVANGDTRWSSIPSRDTFPTVPILTPREWEVLQGICVDRS